MTRFMTWVMTYMSHDLDHPRPITGRCYSTMGVCMYDGVVLMSDDERDVVGTGGGNSAGVQKS